MYDMMMFFPALNMHVLVHLVVMLAWKKNSSYCYLTIYSEVVKDDATYMRKKILLSLLRPTWVSQRISTFNLKSSWISQLTLCKKKKIQTHIVGNQLVFRYISKYTWNPSYVHDPNFITQVCSSKGKYSTSISHDEW